MWGGGGGGGGGLKAPQIKHYNNIHNNVGTPTDWLTDCLILIYLNDLLIDLFVYWWWWWGGGVAVIVICCFVCLLLLFGGWVTWW